MIVVPSSTGLLTKSSSVLILHYIEKEQVKREYITDGVR